jgi:hypothetical protein
LRASDKHHPFLPRRAWLQLARSWLLSHPSRTSRTASNTIKSEGEAEWSASREQYPLPFSRMRRCPLTAIWKNRKETEKDATHLPLVMQPALALSPLVVPVVLHSFYWLAGFPIMCWRSFSYSPSRSRSHKRLHARRQEHRGVLYEAERECSCLARRCRLL